MSLVPKRGGGGGKVLGRGLRTDHKGKRKISIKKKKKLERRKRIMEAGGERKGGQKMKGKKIPKRTWERLPAVSPNPSSKRVEPVVSQKSEEKKELRRTSREKKTKGT